MQHRLCKTLLLVLMLCWLLPGCGGGGGTSQQVFPLSTRMRSLQSADTWTYDVTGTARNNATMQSVNLTGTITTTVVQVNLGNTTGPAFSTSYDLTASNGNKVLLNTITHFDQDVNGNVFDLADNGGANNTLRVLTTIDLELPGTWHNGFSHAQQRTYLNGDILNVTTSVVGSENVSSRLGTFATWKTLSTSSVPGSGLQQAASTSWYAPQIGNAVRGEASFSAGDIRLTLTYVLRSTNVPLQ